MKVLQTGLGVMREGAIEVALTTCTPSRLPCSLSTTSSRGPSRLATSGSAVLVKVVGQPGEPGGMVFLWPLSQEVLELFPTVAVVSVL